MCAPAYMLYFKSPLSVVTLNKSGIAKPSDLEGRTIGAAAADGAYRLFSTYAKTTGIDGGKIKWNMVGLQLREAVLANGSADAILGFEIPRSISDFRRQASLRVISRSCTIRMQGWISTGTPLCCRRSSAPNVLMWQSPSSPSAPAATRLPCRSQGGDCRAEGAFPADQCRSRRAEAALAHQEPVHDG